MPDFLTGLRTRTLAMVVAAVVALVYLPSVRYGFVGLDDPDYVLENPHVLSGLSWDNAVWAVRDFETGGNWHPLAWVSLQADACVAALSGEPVPETRLARVMHAHNVAVHVVNATLLFILIALVSGNRFAALFFALAWAIHPLRLEAVCWVTERKEVLCVMFMLMTLLAYARGGGTRWRWTGELPSLAFFTLAVLSKPLAVTLPCVLLAWEWVVRRKTFLRSLLVTLPYFALSAALVPVTLAAFAQPLEVGRMFTPVQRLAMTLSAPVVYLRQTFWPSGLASFYPSDAPFRPVETALGAVLVVAIVWVSVRWLRRRERWAGACAVGVAWCYVGLLPMLGIVKVGDQAHSDRYTYWVGCGVAALAAWAVARVAETSAFRRWWSEARGGHLAYAGVAVLAVLVLLTSRRMPVWSCRMAHYADSVYKYWNESAVRAYARELRKTGKGGSAEAERVLRHALVVHDVVELRTELAHLIVCERGLTPFWKGGNDPAFAEARSDARLAIQANPREGRAWEVLGIADLREGEWVSAKENLLRAAELMREADAPREHQESVRRLLAICDGHL